MRRVAAAAVEDARDRFPIAKLGFPSLLCGFPHSGGSASLMTTVLVTVALARPLSRSLGRFNRRWSYRRAISANFSSRAGAIAAWELSAPI